MQAVAIACPLFSLSGYLSGSPNAGFAPTVFPLPSGLFYGRCLPMSVVQQGDSLNRLFRTLRNRIEFFIPGRNYSGSMTSHLEQAKLTCPLFSLSGNYPMFPYRIRPDGIPLPPGFFYVRQPMPVVRRFGRVGANGSWLAVRPEIFLE